MIARPHPTASAAESPLHESELVIAYFRLALSIFAVWNPGSLFGLPKDPTEAALLVGAVGVYNLLTGLAYWKHVRLRLRRHLMLLMDVALISWWMRLCGPDRSALFPFYYIVVFIAAIWFKAFGALAMALLCSGLWVAIAGAEETALVPMLIAPLPSMLLIAAIGGVVSEIHDREHAQAQELRQRVSLYEREIDLSREIQKLLRPEALPTSPRVELAAAERPSRAVGGGDYYDAFRVAPDRLAFCVADVAGKSIRAQSRLPLLKYALRAVVREEPDPAVVVGELNRLLYDDLQPDLFITLLFGVIDETRGCVRCCNAGHSAPIQYGANGTQPQAIATAGPAVGLTRTARYQNWDIALPRAGDGFIVYTDGVVNATHRVTGEFGEQRLLHFIGQHHAEGAQALAQAIVRCVDDFEESGRTDDATVLVVRVRE